MVLAVNPLYFGLANSFMTDVPFISLLIISIYFFVRGIDKNLNSNIAAGVLFSILAILIRQLGVLVLIGFAVAYLIKYGPSLKNFLKVVLLVFMGLLAHFYISLG
ncbi:MAG: glycosyltransferase family 39 protein [Betaproteobacteria bacterium]|nr:glycosyltransferase family 39 protein [Betaproteobacteria bacterium]